MTMQQTQPISDAVSDFKIIEHYLQVPIVDITQSKSLPNSNSIGLLARIDPHPNVIRKTISLLHASTRSWLLSMKLKRQGYEIEGKFGVYPNVEMPVTIYELNSSAERYCNTHVLPVLPPSLNGRIRLMIMKLARCHPSVAGIVLIARKK